jgi:hypothetical protein
MDLTNFSLIYPDEKTLKAHYSGEDRADIAMFELEELGLLDIFELRSGELSEFFTQDERVMKYRMEVFEDMLSNEDISKMISDVCTPNGTTIKAVDYLEKRGFEQALADAMLTCTKRANMIEKEIEG